MSLSTLHLAALGPDGAVRGYALVFGRDHGYDGEEFLVFRQRLAMPFLYIDQVVVSASSRGAGVGREIYSDIAKRACQFGATALCCEVNASPPNPGSLAFHQAMGFASLGELATQDGRRVVLMHRPLALSAWP